MAARHTTITATPGAPTLLTSGAVTACRVSNLSGYLAYLQATTTNEAPASRDGAIPLQVTATLAADIPLVDLFGGLGDGPFYLWAIVDMGSSFSVSHA